MQKYFQRFQALIRRVRCSYLALGLLLILNCGIVVTSPIAQASSCNDVNFIFARGSGEEPDDVNYQEWVQAISKTLKNTNLKITFHELGADPYNEGGYQAATVAGLEGSLNIIGVALSAGEAFKFGNSVKKGIKELKEYTKLISDYCPQTKFVLGGYSQGAMVMTKALYELDTDNWRELDPDKIIYYAAFGDPKTFLPEGNPEESSWHIVPAACRGEKLSSYRAYVPDCWAYEGILNGQDPYHIEALEGKVGLWCNKNDIMCSSGISLTDHTHYIEGGLYDDAAQTIYQKLVKAFPNRNFEFSKVIGWHDLVLLIDATESMETTINKYAEEAKKISKLVYANHGRVALYYYWDHSDPHERCAFETCTADFLEKDIGNIVPMGGGDSDESLLYSAYYAMSHLNWRNGATKTIVALTDAGFHKNDYKNITIKEVVEKSLSIDPVNFYVIAPKRFESEYQELTSRTGGKFFDVDNLEQIELSTELITKRPVAKLSLSEYYAKVGDEITFDASGSYGMHDNLEYDWDLDGDGEFEDKYINAGPIVEKKYDSIFENFIQVRVRDGSYSSTMSAKVFVAENFNLEPLASITNLTAESLDATSAKISYSTNGDKVVVKINDALLGLQNVASNKSSFIINDIVGDMTVTLTPYSESGKRGQSDSIIVTGKVSGDNKNPSDDDNSTNGDDEKPGDDTSDPKEDDNKTDVNPATPDGSESTSNPNPPSLPDVPILGAPNNGSAENPLTTTFPFVEPKPTTPSATPELLPSAPNTGAVDPELLAKLKD